jgi:hypothetical protein
MKPVGVSAMMVNDCLTTIALYSRRLIITVTAMRTSVSVIFNDEKVALESNFLLLVVCSVRRKIKAGRSQLYF